MTGKRVNTLSTLSTRFHTIHKPAGLTQYPNSPTQFRYLGIEADDIDVVDIDIDVDVDVDVDVDFDDVDVDVDVDDVDVRQDLRELALDSSPRLHNRPPSILS